MIFQFVDEKQSSYYVINYLNLAVGWWNWAGTIFSMSFWRYMNGKGLGRFEFVSLPHLSLQSHLKLSSATSGQPVDVCVACEHLPRGCCISDVHMTAGGTELRLGAAGWFQFPTVQGLSTVGVASTGDVFGSQ